MVLAVSGGATVALVVVAAALAALIASVVTASRRSRDARSRLVAMAQGVDLDVDERGDLEALIATIERSVRASRQDTDAERESRVRLQATIDSLSDAVLLYDADGALVGSNAAAAPIIDARHGDALVGAALADLVREARVGTAGSTTLELFGPPRRSVVITTVPVPSAGGQIVVARVEDVTERRLLEAVRTDFVANISHELKTPIGAIGLLAETLEDETDPEVAARLARRLHAEALRVGRTIDDLLELSRIESSAPVIRSRFDMADVIAESVARIRPAAEQSGVELLTVDVAGGLVVDGDRLQLQSVVSNLLDNAVKYSDAGASVNVTGTHIDGSISISIADRGIGIPSRDIERIFERFYRVDQARSRATGGTGLGLSIVRHIVSNHGGTIEVESRLGEGSTFTLVLPGATEPSGDER